jgi:hypothetical protein
VGISYVHVVLRTSGEVVGVLFVDHGGFCWGRNRERSMEFASLLSEVTLLDSLARGGGL